MITTKLIYKVDGREVSSQEYAENLTKEMMQKIREKTQAEIESVRCPIHNKTGKAILQDGSGANFGYTIDGCCDALAEAVHARFRQ